KIAFDDIALLVDQKGSGCELDIAEGLGDFALRVDGHGKGQVPCFSIVLYVIGGIILHGHGNGVETLGRQVVVVLDGVGHLRDAGDAAGGPELDQHNLAAQVLHGGLFAGERGEGDVGSSLGRAGKLPDADSGQGQYGDNANKCFFHWTGMVSTPLEESGVLVEPVLEASSTGAGDVSAAMLSGETIWNNFTTLLTPLTPAATLPARWLSSSVTLPIR